MHKILFEAFSVQDGRCGSNYLFRIVNDKLDETEWSMIMKMTDNVV